MIHKILLVVFTANFCNIAPGSTSENRIVINVPTAEQEAQYVWRTIRDIPFFEKYGYRLSLPEGPIIEKLSELARSNQLTDEHYIELETYLKEEVHNTQAYQNAVAQITNHKEILTHLLQQLEQTNRNWTFKSFPQYQINLTLYGPGGSYDPDNGTITLFTTPEGNFKLYKSPVNTLIHEIVHIGIEDAVIRPNNVPHGLKERIVDKFLLLFFDTELPGYRLQNLGDPTFDQHLQKKEDLADLANIVANFLAKR